MMELLQDTSDVAGGGASSNDADSRILHQFMDESVR